MSLSCKWCKRSDLANGKAVSVHLNQCPVLTAKLAAPSTSVSISRFKRSGATLSIPVPKRRKTDALLLEQASQSPTRAQHRSLSDAPPFQSEEHNSEPCTAIDEPSNASSPLTSERPPEPPSTTTLRIRIPSRLSDVLPEGPGDVDPQPSPPAPPSPRRTISIPARRNETPEVWRTRPNKFGLFREYPHQPLTVPDASGPTSRFDSNTLLPPPVRPPIQLRPKLADALGPFPNLSTFLHGKWMWMHETRTSAEAAGNDLIKDVYQDKDFDSKQVKASSLPKIKEALASWQPDPFSRSEGWKTSDVKISVPFGFPRKGRSHPLSADYTVPGLHHRSIVDVVKRVLTSDPNVADFHFYPYREYVKQPRLGDDRLRVFNDIFSSDSMLTEYSKLMASPKEPGCSLERVVVGLQFWSDSTQLANFGSAKLWPVYMSFGNQPKWARSRASMHACHDVAHIPSLPASFQDWIREQRGFPADKRLKTHCCRELFQGVWLLLIDKKFRKAYKHGIVIVFPDGVARRVYLRIVTYSADYPEKVLIVTIRDLGNCPCPRCLVKKHLIRKLGDAVDMRQRSDQARSDNAGRQWLVKRARKLIYEKGRGVASKWVEALLKDTSSVPTENAFSKRLSKYGFDFFVMILVDLLHEFELGVWKAVLMHLIRMLHSIGPEAVEEMNARFRKIPPFGRSTIRRFKENVSELKQMAGRDYEDLLQCALPVFEGLFPKEWDGQISDLLFVLADWHSLAKLQLHTDTTLDQLSTATKVLGKSLRHFADVICPKLKTKELPREAAARARRQQQLSAGTTAPTVDGGRKPKTFNLSTYKLHGLGHYVPHIRYGGTTDVYNSQIGEARHRTKKIQYKSTNKRDFEKQVAKKSTIAENIRLIDVQVAAARGLTSFAETSRTAATKEADAIGPSDAKYFIAKRGEIATLSDLLYVNRRDPAMKHFRYQLLDHLLARLRTIHYSSDVPLAPTSELSRVDIAKDRLHFHMSAQFNYTTYNVRRSQDSIKPALSIDKDLAFHPGNSDRNTIFVASSEDDRVADEHPFWYARVLAIFHVDAKDLRPDVPYTNKEHERIDVLWVRWLGRDLTGTQGGWASKRLDRVGYVPDSDQPGAFGFVDPADVIRCAHLMPAFEYGTNDEFFKKPSFVQDDDGTDLAFYYVGRFEDRDLSMRYRGGGVGHIDPRQYIRTEIYTEATPGLPDQPDNTDNQEGGESEGDEGDDLDDDEDDESEEEDRAGDDEDELLDEEDLDDLYLDDA